MRLTVIGFAAAALVGCTSGEPAKPTAASPVKPTTTLSAAPVDAPAAGPSPESDSWGLAEHKDGHAGLYFGPDESDALPISLTCRHGSRQVDIDLYLADFQAPTEGPAPWRMQTTFVSGDFKASYPAEVEYDGEVLDAYYASANLPSSDPLLTRFRRNGRLSAPDGLERDYPATTEAERAAIERFFAYCEAQTSTSPDATPAT